MPTVLLGSNEYLEQIWHIQPLDKDHITISSPGTGRYLGLHGEAHPNAFVVAGQNRQVWRLKHSDEKKGFYNIIFPRQFNGEDIAIGVSALHLRPPRVALQFRRGFGGDSVHWELQKVE
ncbi:hypothetical protein BX616_008002 [Lobosporangium transversale]|nr:hypothetical protein BX616_008002 [Lobosporangium transversale]